MSSNAVQTKAPVFSLRANDIKAEKAVKITHIMPKMYVDNGFLNFPTILEPPEVF